MIKQHKLKYILILGAFIIVTIVAIIKPEYVENVAQAFLLILGII